MDDVTNPDVTPPVTDVVTPPVDTTKTETVTPAASTTTEGDNVTPPVTETVSPPVDGEGTDEGPSEETIATFQAEFDETQGLSEESYAKLGEMGYDKSMVDAYIRGATQVLSSDDADSLITKFGGQEQFEGMQSWAAANLSPEDLETYNGALQTKASSEMAMNWLKSKMIDAEGHDAAIVVKGNTPPPPAPDVYADRKEVIAAMRDPKYGKDRAYTKAVEAKVGRSRLF